MQPQKKFDPLGLLLVLAGCWLLFAGGDVAWPKLPWPIVVSPFAPAAPFVTDKPRVLLVEESLDRRNYTSEQLAVVDATAAGSVRAVLLAKGGELHVIDEDTPADKLQLAPAWVQAAFKVPRQSVPWVVGADSRTGFSMPLTGQADVLAKVEGLK